MNEETVETPEETIAETSEGSETPLEDSDASSETVTTYAETSEPVPIINYDEVIWGELVFIRYILIFIALFMLASRFIRVGR